MSKHPQRLLHDKGLLSREKTLLEPYLRSRKCIPNTPAPPARGKLKSQRLPGTKIRTLEDPEASDTTTTANTKHSPAARQINSNINRNINAH